MTIARVIKNKIQYFIEIISLPSIKKLKFSLFLYNLKWVVYIIFKEVIKNRTIDIGCIIKWGGKIDKIAFWCDKS